MNKRGVGLGDLYPAVILIILVGLVIGIGIFVLNQTSDAISSTDIAVVNESMVFTNGSGLQVATAADCGASNFVITSVWNNSDGVIPTSNYTFSSVGTLTAGDGSIYEDVPANVSYTYKGTRDTSSTGACGVMSTTSTATGTLADWIAVIVVVLAAAIVLGIVISSFGNKGNAS